MNEVKIKVTIWQKEYLTQEYTFSSFIEAQNFIFSAVAHGAVHTKAQIEIINESEVADNGDNRKAGTDTAGTDSTEEPVQ